MTTFIGLCLIVWGISRVVKYISKNPETVKQVGDSVKGMFTK